MTNVWDFINTINGNKSDVLKTAEEGKEVAESIYSSFVVNRHMSYFTDTIMHANLINMHNTADNKMQYHYYLYGVPARKRFTKWHKQSNSEYINDIMMYYNCNRHRAVEYSRILTDEQIQDISNSIHKGGLEN